MTRVAEVRAHRAAMEAPPPLPAVTQAEPYLRRLVIPDRGQRLVVPTDEIVWIEAETLGSLSPALRAIRIEPTEALRNQ